MPEPIASPPRNGPFKGGLFEVAPPRTLPESWINSGITYLRACGTIREFSQIDFLCNPDPPEKPEPDTFTGTPVFNPRWAYSAFTCATAGNSLLATEAAARDILESQLELAVSTGWVESTINDFAIDDLSPGVAVSAGCGLALLESYIIRQSGRVATLYLDPAVVSRLLETHVLETTNHGFVTRLGSQVVVVPTDGITVPAAPTGSFWALANDGVPQVHLGKVQVLDESAPLLIQSNSYRVALEQPWLVYDQACFQGRIAINPCL